MTTELMFRVVGLLIGILSVGAALAWLIAAGLASIRAELHEGTERLNARMASVERVLKRIEVLADGLPTALARVKAAD